MEKEGFRGWKKNGREYLPAQVVQIKRKERERGLKFG